MIAIILSFILLFTLTACGDDKEKEKEDDHILKYTGAVNTTTDPDSKWYNSSIYGAIDDTLSVDEKDDFYTAVNKDWLVNHEPPTEDAESDAIFTRCMDISKDRLIKIVSGMDDPDARNDGMIDIPLEELEHDQKLVVTFAKAASDWDGRNSAGAEPLRPYIEAIESIASMEDMSRYITDFENDNFSQERIFDVETLAGVTDADTYQTLIAPNSIYTLYSIKEYMDMDLYGRSAKHNVEQVVNNALSKLGYSEKQISEILRRCYAFEGMLADHTNIQLSQTLDSYKTGYTLEELQDMAGDFPVTDIMKAMGFGITEDLRLSDPSYLKYLGRIYKSSNLNLIKSYYIVHTIHAAAKFMDRESYDAIAEIEELNSTRTVISTTPDGGGDRTEEEIKDEWDLILEGFVKEYLSGPLDIVYVSRYCSDEQKREIEELVDEVVERYHGIIDDVSWLTESAKEAAKEKLEYITVKVLYPKSFDSYLELDFAEDDDLLKMVQKINHFKVKTKAGKAGSEYDKSRWDLDDVSTTDTNAYYMPMENSINILAGILSSGEMFDPEREDEINMAYLGTVVGHEISHAFDSTGCYYDKYGNKERWWDANDLSAFEMMVMRVDRYYNTISPYPGASNLSASVYSGEAIADMGGMHVMLEIAKDMPGFDYDLFFRSYARLWSKSCSFGEELAHIENDVHPLVFLRTNVTLAQFDEFMDTYGISEGDGMYLEKERRIKVW